MSRWIEPVTLEGEHVRLVPLTAGHEQALTAAASDGELWKLWYTFVPSPDKTRVTSTPRSTCASASARLRSR